MTILVTGATGFVISNLVRYLAEEGHDVVAADLNSPDDLLKDYLSGLAGRVTVRQLDVGDAGAVERFVDDLRPTLAVHGAAITAIPPEVERARFLTTVQVNVMGTLHVLEALRRAAVGRIVVVSSGSVYGARASYDPIHEDAPKGPRALYPLTKWAAEALADRFGEINQLDLGIVRLCSPFGPFERDTGSRPLLSPIQQWTTAALRGETIRAEGSPDMLRDVAYVADVASGIAAVLLAERLPSRVYNVGWGRGATSRETLEALSRHVPGLRYEFADGPSPWVSTANAPRGPLDSTRLRSELGWTPRYDLDSGLAAYIAWLRQTG